MNIEAGIYTSIYTVADVSTPHCSDIITHKLEHVPVKYIIIREALSVEQVPEELA